MVGLVLDELQTNAMQAALDHWTQYLSERLVQHEQEPDTPAQRDAIESLSMALADVDRVKAAIREALEDPETEYPGEISDPQFYEALRRAYDPSVRWHEYLDR